jgi:hypothetical protein
MRGCAAYQVRILRLMRILGRGDVQTSEKLSDTLARVRCACGQGGGTEV